MPSPRVIVVTGANRGIGQAVCRLILARQHPSPIKLIATSRNGEHLGFTSSQGHEVVYSKLDIAEAESVRRFADELETQHGQAHVLINNAGVNLDAEYSHETAKKTLEVNYGGTKDMCLSLLPLLTRSASSSEAPRIVNISSVASSLKAYSNTIQTRFRDANVTLSELSELQSTYLAAVRDHAEESAGFFGPGRSYSVSKALVNALTVLLARDNPGVLVNACCPGWIDTDMGGLVGSKTSRPPKTPEEGARIPVRLALDDLKGVTGKYWANGSVRSKDEGEVQEW